MTSIHAKVKYVCLSLGVNNILTCKISGSHSSKCICCSHTNIHSNCSVVHYSTMFQTPMWTSYQEKLKIDTKICWLIFQRECVIIVHLESIHTFVNEQKAVISIIIHIITVLSVLHWQAQKCERRIFFSFSLHLSFIGIWFKGSV
jgi:hypothetical protein